MSATQTVTVDLGDRSYPIHIGPDLLAGAGEYIAPLLSIPHVVIITDEQVAPHHLATLEAALSAADITYYAITLPAGEGTKSFAVLEGLLDALLDRKPERKTTLIALGGGVIGDLVGFAASILLRGVPFIQIPTTLLAQVDSSVGGKTGINSVHGKNLIGSFYQPKLVLADTDVLKTLPARQRKAGYAEIVKYALIDDVPFFDWLEANGKAVLDGDVSALTHAIKTSCEHKARIVKEDEREGGKRALLNLGHTFGHALEAETGFGDELLHGEAVAIGTVLAFQLSAAKGLCPQEDVTRILHHFTACDLMTQPKELRPHWNIPALIHHFSADKKVEQGRMTFILARGIGQSFITQDVQEEELVNLLEAACQI